MSDPFIALGLNPLFAETLSGLGYTEPTPIQREAIPALLEGRDVLGQAATGTGKTAAFALPLLHRLAENAETDRPIPSILVLVPTRELAIQVGEAMATYGRPLRLRVVSIFGGQAFDPQLRALRKGVHVVVATPGRALDHIRRKTLDLKNISAVVLDEADEMLDMGFADELEAILEGVPKERQTALFSATMAPRIARIADRNLKDPVRVSIAREKPVVGSGPRVRQAVYIVPRALKLSALSRVLDFEAPTAAIVFCRTRVDVDHLADSLSGRGYGVEALHGGMSQQERDRVMKKVRSGVANLLIATDVAARGLDIDLLTHVINYDVPTSPDVYVHRIGRTGRAGRDGTALTLAEPREGRVLREAERLTGQTIEITKVPSAEQARSKRLEITSDSLRRVMAEGSLHQYQTVLDSLASDFSVQDLALAAVKLAHEATVGKVDETDIPDYDNGRPKRERKERPERERRPARALPTSHTEGGEAMGRLYVTAGKRDRIRPGDIVGVLVNAAGVQAANIGMIKIGERFSLVDVPEAQVQTIIDTLDASTMRGVKIGVRRDREGVSGGDTAPREPRESRERPRAPRERRAPPRGGRRSERRAR